MKEIIKMGIKIISKYKIIILILFLGVIFVTLFSKIVPYNMDEFVHYHTIMCHHYKYNAINTFRESCKGYDLNLFNTGLILPLRAFSYTGSFPSFYYYPIFLIWKSPLSARFLGIIFLLLQALILGKIFKIKYEYIFIGLVTFFPYFFQHIVDTGPVGFQITSVFIIYYFFIRWFKDFKIICPILISITIFLGIWTKLSYFWLIPGIIIILLIHVFEKREEILQRSNLKKIFFQSGISILLLIGLLSLIFLSTNPENPNDYPYLNQLMNSDSYSLKEIFHTNIILRSRVFSALINPFEATQRIYHVNPISLFVLIYNLFIYLSIPLFGMFLWIIAKKDSKKHIIKSLILFSLFIITFLFILKSKGSWAMHHTILSFPFLILSFLSIISYLKNNKIFNSKYITSKKIILSIFLLFILLNSYFFILFPNQKIYLNQENRRTNDFSKNELNKILYNEYLSKTYFYVVIDWGIYYYQALYGNKFQSVFYMEPLNQKWKIDRLKELSEKYNRKILFIYNSKSFSSNDQLIRSSFDIKPCNPIKEESVWKIELEPDNNNENICFQ
jgi:hypothetical protein